MWKLSLLRLALFLRGSIWHWDNICGSVGAAKCAGLVVEFYRQIVGVAHDAFTATAALKDGAGSEAY